MRKVGFLFPFFQSRTAFGVARLWAAVHLIPMRFFIGGGFFDVIAHPIADLAIGCGIFYDINHLFVGDARILKPERIETFSKIFGVIGMQFSCQVKADLINVTGQVRPAIHRFARTARVNNLTHAKIIRAARRVVNYLEAGVRIGFENPGVQAILPA
jgi:hypothetical protein